MLSHELRNPLAPIFAATQLLALQSDENPIQLRARTVIERQIKQLAHLVDDLLDVSRVTTGRIRLQLEQVDLREIVQRAVESVRPIINKRRHELSISLPSDPVWLQADITRIEQVIVNLLNNAAKYTDEGGQIWLDVKQETGFAVLLVRDNGAGIAPELLDNIFDLFSQAKRTLGRAQGGLGIGLTLVQKIVELHHGKVAASSAGLGQGSEFTIWLPVVDTKISQESASSGSSDSVAPGARILLVDDNVDVIDVCHRPGVTWPRRSDSLFRRVCVSESQGVSSRHRAAGYWAAGNGWI